jgi:parvulin-like peptidyl-prolyl isomerase
MSQNMGKGSRTRSYISAQASSPLRAIMATYRASHILVKHENSRRKASRKDPEGAQITKRTRAEAVATLEGFIAQLQAAPNLVAAFAELAQTQSDCGSAQSGGDLGEFGPVRAAPQISPWWRWPPAAVWGALSCHGSTRVACRGR